MTTKYEEFTKVDLKRVITVGGISVVVILIGVGFLLLVRFPVGFIIFILFCVAGILLDCIWLAKTYAPFALRCPECGHEFEVSGIRFFFSPTVGPFKKEDTVKKYFRCPKCGKRSSKIALKRGGKQEKAHG